MPTICRSGVSTRKPKPGLAHRRVGGRFAGVLELSTKQGEFVQAYVALGGCASAAAQQAGYSDSAHEGFRLLNNTHVRDAIHAEQARVIGCELASRGVKTLLDLMQSEDTPAHVKFQAARFCIESAGHGIAAPVTPGAGKDLAEMSLAELGEFVATGREVIRSLTCVDVEGAASPAMSL